MPDESPDKPPAAAAETAAPVRQWWLAALLALLVPGLGHLYVGRVRPALAVPLIQSAAVLLIPLLSILAGLSLGLLVLWSIIGVGFWLAQAIWAAQIARAMEAPPPPRFRRVGVYVVFLLGATLITSLSAAVSRGTVIEAFKIPAASMVPTILPGDQIFVAKIGPGSDASDYGDLVVFAQPESGETYIKRVVGRGGDRLEMRSGSLLLNGTALQRQPCDPPVVTYRDRAAPGQWYEATGNCWLETMPTGASYRILEDTDAAAAAADLGPVVVPHDHLFVVGDNRDHSYDSRSWGPVPADHVIGRARLVWWSWDPVVGLRSERLGLTL